MQDIDYTTATYTTSIARSGLGYRATATFPAGPFSARRPVQGATAPTVRDAIASLLQQPMMVINLTSIVTPTDWGNIDA